MLVKVLVSGDWSVALLPSELAASGVAQFSASLCCACLVGYTYFGCLQRQAVNGDGPGVTVTTILAGLAADLTVGLPAKLPLLGCA